MDGDRENFAEFPGPNKESSSSPPSQTDIPVVSLHQSLLRQHHLSLNQPKEQNNSQRRDNNSQHHHHQQQQPVQEERDYQMLLNDSQLPVPLQTPKLGDIKGEPQICHPLNTRFNQAPQSKPTSWTCSLCPLKYKRPADLNRHMKRKHGMSLMKNDKNVLVPIVISQQHKPDYNDLQPLNLSLKCAFSDASFESAESMESEMTIDDDQPLDLSSNKNNPIDYRQKTLNKSFDHCADGKVYTSSKINMTEKSFNTFNIAIPNAFHSGRTSISAPAIRYRPFKCSECGRRSNWRWDLNKHIRTSNHPHAHLIELSEHVARATFHEVLKKDSSYCDTVLPDIQNLQPDSNSTAVEASGSSIPAQYKQYLCNACGYRSGWKCDMVKHVKLLHKSTSITLLTEIIAKETLPNYEKHHQDNKDGSDWIVESNRDKSQQLVHGGLCVNPLESSDYLVVSCSSMDGSFPFSSSHTVDARKTKKFKCSACPYRSNFRSDVGRHIRHKHDRATCRIVVMSEAEAASTLGEYMDTWARKKFVPSPNKRRCLMPLSCLHATEVYCGQSRTSPFAISPTSSMTEHVKPMTLAFAQESSLESHMKKSKRWWKCSSCDFRDQSKDVIVQHWHYKHNNVSIGSEETPFLCDVVGPVAEFSSFPEAHHLGRKEETSRISPELKDAFDNESNEISNERKTESSDHDVPEDRKLACDVCPYNTNAQELLDVHKSYHKASEGSTFSCTFCQYFVPTSPLLNQHLLLHVEENKSSQTPRCSSPNESNQNSNDSKSQVDDTSSPVNLSNVSTPLLCSDSEKPHDKVSMFLMTNAIRAGGRTTYLCSQCPYVSCNRNDYLYHRQFHRPRPTAFKCPHCPYWVSQKRLLSQHYKVHELDYQQKHRGQDYTEVLIKQRVEYFSSGDKNNNSLDISKNNSSKTFDTPIQVIQQTESLNCPTDNGELLAASEVTEVIERADDNLRRSSAENTFGISDEKGVFLKSLGLTASLA